MCKNEALKVEINGDNQALMNERNICKLLIFLLVESGIYADDIESVLHKRIRKDEDVVIFF